MHTFPKKKFYLKKRIISLLGEFCLILVALRDAQGFRRLLVKKSKLTERTYILLIKTSGS